MTWVYKYSDIDNQNKSPSQPLSGFLDFFILIVVFILFNFYCLNY